MKSVIIFLVFVANVLFLYGVLGKSTHRNKHEDNYIKSENDISNGAPLLPIEGGYKDIDETITGTSSENLERFYDMRSMYGTDSGFDINAPYYYYIYDPRAFYDPDSHYYMGGGLYDLDTKSYIPDHRDDVQSEPQDETQSESTTYIYDDMIQQTTELYDDIPKSTEQQEVRTIDSEMPTPYWLPPENVFAESRVDNNPYWMAIPAQLQSFPMFEQHYQPEYEDYERIAEEERRLEELEAQGLDVNTVEDPELFPRSGRSKRSFAKSLNLRDRNTGGRVKRDFSRLLNLRDKSNDKAAYVQSRKSNGNTVNVVLNGDCRGRSGQGQGQGQGRGNGAGGAGGAGNAVDQAAGAAQDAAGTIANAAGDAVDAAAEATDNLRLRNGRRGGNRRNGNNRNGRQ